MLNLYSTDERINPFVIGCIINPSLRFNDMFREKVEND